LVNGRAFGDLHDPVMGMDARFTLRRDLRKLFYSAMTESWA